MMPTVSSWLTPNQILVLQMPVTRARLIRVGGATLVLQTTPVQLKAVADVIRVRQKPATLAPVLTPVPRMPAVGAIPVQARTRVLRMLAVAAILVQPIPVQPIPVRQIRVLQTIPALQRTLAEVAILVIRALAMPVVKA